MTPVKHKHHWQMCSHSNSEPCWRLMRRLRDGGVVDTHNLLLDKGELGSKRAGSLLRSPEFVSRAHTLTFPLVFCFSLRHKDIVGWMSLSEMFWVGTILKHSWLSLLLCICVWVARGGTKEGKSGPHCCAARVWTTEWGLLCRLNRGDRPVEIPAR